MKIFPIILFVIISTWNDFQTCINDYPSDAVCDSCYNIMLDPKIWFTITSSQIDTAYY